MYRIILMFCVIGSVMIFFGCQQEDAIAPELSQNEKIPASFAKPLPNLIGTINCLFNFPPLPDPGGSGLPVFWKGTITFGEATYGLYFISHGEPRAYSQASPFYEEFVIHEDGNEGNVYVKGWDAGVMTLANNDPDPVKALGNGRIEEAYGPFEEWQGRNVHMRVIVTWVAVGLPEAAFGTLRIN